MSLILYDKNSGKPAFGRIVFVLCLTALLALELGISRMAMAQALQPLREEGGSPSDQGRVTIQGRQGDEEPLLDEPVGVLLDFKEEMRLFIQTISRYARGLKPEFVIIVEDGLELLTKVDVVDAEIVSPARAYTRSIDGIMEVGLFHGVPFFGQPHDDPKIQEVRLANTDRAHKESLPVLVLDKTDQTDQVNAGYKQSRQRGYIYSSIFNQEVQDSILPKYPARPFNENSTSILSLGSVKNFAIIGNPAVYGRQDEFALRMHKTNYDMLIVDVFLGGQPLKRQTVATLKYKQIGARRMVLARVNIGTAARYYYYWKRNWSSGSPLWIGAPMKRDPDRYFVEYWRPEWQRIITGDTQSLIYGLLAQGYDGVVLSDVDVYNVLESGGEPDLE